METPDWSQEIRTRYLAGAANQFLLHGNVDDRVLLPGEGNEAARMGNLRDFLVHHQLERFDLVFRLELGAGLRLERGEELLARLSFSSDFPTAPPEAIGWLDRFLRFCVNLRQLSPEEFTGKGKQESAGDWAGRNLHVAIIVMAADLVFPVSRQTRDYQLGSMAAVVRSWSHETHFLEQNLAVFLVTENLHDLHGRLARNPRAASIEIPLPGEAELRPVFDHFAEHYPRVLENFRDRPGLPAKRLAGATLGSIESLLRMRNHEEKPLVDEDLSGLKKSLVEKDAQGLIEFLEPDRNLDGVYGHDAVKEWIREDIALWKKGEIDVMPMGYLFCGPVGTGKTYIVECLAGEAGVPVVKLKNFRDRWVGSTEGNLERIFHLLHALGRCIVFIDEADQALGSRDSGSGDSGVSGRVYSMMAKEMSNTRNRGRILWILASSRPDLIEVDLKRPGRVDVKIPLFPAHELTEGYRLIRALCRKHDLTLPEEAPDEIEALIPPLVTPGAAESIAIKVYRSVKTRDLSPLDALRDCLDEYQSPVPEETMRFQIGLAVREASDLAFVPREFRSFA